MKLDVRHTSHAEVDEAGSQLMGLMVCRVPHLDRYPKEGLR